MEKWLACCNLNKRKEILTLFKDLPLASVATDDEVLFFIEQQKLMGRGIGNIDTHLLAAVALNSSARLYTRDKRLREVSDSLSLTFEMD